MTARRLNEWRPGGTTFGYLVRWPELLADAKALRPGHPAWVWEELEKAHGLLTAPATAQSFAELADLLLRHAKPPLNRPRPADAQTARLEALAARHPVVRDALEAFSREGAPIAEAFARSYAMSGLVVRCYLQEHGGVERPPVQSPWPPSPPGAGPADVTDAQLDALEPALDRQAAIMAQHRPAPPRLRLIAGGTR